MISFLGQCLLFLNYLQADTRLIENFLVQLWEVEVNIEDYQQIINFAVQIGLPKVALAMNGHLLTSQKSFASELMTSMVFNE